MAAQLTLFQSKAQHACELWDEANPEIYREFDLLVLELIDAGFTHWGAKAIFEVLRYNRRIKSRDPDFALNNNMTAYYARKWMAEHPEYPEFFEIRRSNLDE